MRKTLAHHSPWLFIAIIGFGINWFWWIDAAVRPATKVHYEKTEISPKIARPGATISIRGYGEVLRACDKKFRRILTFPGGESIELTPGNGTKFTPGEGSVLIEIFTDPAWPAGEYEFTSTGIYDCNPPFPKQIIPGVGSSFVLE